VAAGDLIELADLKIRLETTVNESDDVLAAVISAASDAIQEWSGRIYASSGLMTRTFDVGDAGRCGWSSLPASVQVADLQSVDPTPGSVLIVDADGSTVSTLTSSDVVLGPAGASVFETLRLKSTAAGRFGEGYQLTVRGTFGWPEIPSRAREACMATCRAWLRQDSARWSGAVETDDGRVVFPTPEGGWMLPLSAKQLLANDRRRGIV
jgi:hypothetical protein